MQPRRARSTQSIEQATQTAQWLQASGRATKPAPPHPAPPRSSPIKDAIIRWLEQEL